MGKLPLLAIALACLLIPGCQSTPSQSQPTGQPPQSSAQTPQAQSQAQGPQFMAQPLAPAVSSAVKSVNAVYTRSVRPVLSAPIDYLGNKVRELGQMKVRLFGVALPPTELLAIILAAVILVVGGTWTLSSMSRRNR